MGLFDTKYCDICGEKIGFLGGALGIRKLADGNLCKDCQNKLSPFFSEKRSSTVEEIREQLAYREENKADVAAFDTTRAFGTGHTKLYVDTGARRFMVTGASDLKKANPDVIGFDHVTSCTLEKKESRTEEKNKTQDGKQVSYDPPHYIYSYDFDILLTVKHAYFSLIRFRLNGSVVPVKVIGSGSPQVLASINEDYQKYIAMGEEICALLDPLGSKAERPQTETEAPAAAARGETVCPFCGATTVPDANGRCEYCDSVLNA